ncbi:hypothetical protein D9611_007120 [Ephemerocybe angulata]|uniref:F-box domain-containing protein n=1 Tax=Ephemerocybe angulata TaxID=980116 RepID=A0A8H5EW79_9AGAR|nr:hypothetical protein D9611_007120 [Tulosesus angulatus]
MGGHLPTAAVYRQQLSLIRKEAETLERRLSQLKDEEQRVKQQLDDLVLSSSPIGRISDDLLREIFLCTLPNDIERRVLWASSSIRQSVAPMLLCLVSKQWREVAMGYSLLWASLRLRIPPYSHDDMEEPVDVGPRFQFYSQTSAGFESTIKRFFGRWHEMTKASQLQLELITSVYRGHEHPKLLSCIDHRRLTSLSLCGEPVGQLYALQPGSFPLLKDLIIQLIMPPNYRWDKWGPIKAFSTCPQLRRVAVDRLSSKGHPTIILPITQLSHLIVRSASWKYFINYMKECPNLRYMHLVVPSNQERSTLSPKQDTWHWPTLTHLSIDCTSNPPDSYPFLLDHIDLSQLKSLQIFEPNLQWENGLAERFLGRIQSMSSLERLSLGCSEECEMDDPTTALFRCAPRITTLEITAQPPDNQFSEVRERLAMLFLELSNSPDILPCLHTLVLELPCGFTGGLEASVLDFIKSRTSAEAQTRLRRVVLRLTRAAFTLPANHSVCVPELQSDGEEGGLIVELMDAPPEGGNQYNKTNWVMNDPGLSWPEVADLFTKDEVILD